MTLQSDRWGFYMKQGASIQKKVFAGLIAGFAVFAIAILVALSVLLEAGLNGYFKKEFTDDSDVISGQIAELKGETESIVRWFDKSRDVKQIIAEKRRFEASQTAKAVQDSFRLDDVAFFDAEGNSLQDGSSLTGVSAVKSAIAGTDSSDIVINGELVALVAAAPVHIDGKVAGGVAIRRTLGKFEIIQGWKELLNSDITIFAGDTRVATTLVNREGKSLEGTKLDNPKIDDLVLKQGKTYQGFNKINGEMYISSYEPLKVADGSVAGMIFVGRPLKSIRLVSASIYGIVAPGTVAFLVILILVYVFLIQRVVIKPLFKVGNAVHNLASGHADLSQRLEFSSRDELGAIAKDINSFMDILQSLIKDMKATQETLMTIGENLGANARQSASSITEIAANIQGVRNQSLNQTESVRRTNGILSAASVNVGALNASIENQAAGITQSSAAIEEMVGNIGAVTASIEKMGAKFHELVATTEKGRSQLSEVDGRVKKISEQSTLLLEANAIISQIASQTNLLAMNAAIEAAHAGSAGAGFSVVADEIRKLAETSSKQSKTINSELKAISTSIGEVVQSSKNSQDAFGVIVSNIGETDVLVREIGQAMTEQKSASRQILEALRDMNSVSANVQEKSKELLEGVNTVTGEMGILSEISESIHGSMDEMTQGTAEINSAAQDVSDLATETRETIHHMEELLGKFMV
jgi:methyl-accepting chemotaxis protein